VRLDFEILPHGPRGSATGSGGGSPSPVGRVGQSKLAWKKLTPSGSKYSFPAAPHAEVTNLLTLQVPSGACAVIAATTPSNPTCRLCASRRGWPHGSGQLGNSPRRDDIQHRGAVRPVCAVVTASSEYCSG
jgi:hypothetical protein